MSNIQLTKKDFLKIIKESKLDLLEMAVKPGSGKRPIIMGDENQQLIGWDIATNAEDPTEDRLKLLFTCDFEGFKESNPNFAEIIQSELGEGVDWRIVTTVCPGEKQYAQGKKPSEPRRKDYFAHKITPEMGISPEGGEMLDLTQKTTGVSRSESEKIRIKLYNILRKELQENDSLNERFRVLQIPKILISRANSDRYVEPDTNRLISYGTHSALLHKTIDDFIEGTVAALAGDENYNSDALLSYIARQYNREVEGREYTRGAYRNWDAGRLANIKKTGLTPVYKLNRLGFEQDDYGVITMSKFRLKGEQYNNEFKWTIEFQVMFGLLKKDNPQVNLLRMFKDLRVDDSTILPHDFEVPEGSTILDVEEVYNSLLEVIDKFENSILTLDPQSALERANLEQYDRDNELAFVDRGLNEEEITKGDLIKLITEAIGGNEASSDYVDTDIERFDDFITKGKSGRDGIGGEEGDGERVKLQLAKDQNGKFYVMTLDQQNPKIIASFN